MSKNLGEWDGDLENATPDGTEPADAAEDEAPELFYASVAEKLATTYRRYINPGGGIIWCPQWWKHAEAINRLEALWRAWEFLRLEGTTGMSVWWRGHADHHMNFLLSADDPFRGCSPDDDHKSKLPPLPCEEPPEGLF